jgi:hypothetical protein
MTWDIVSDIDLAAIVVSTHHSTAIVTIGPKTIRLIILHSLENDDSTALAACNG